MEKKIFIGNWKMYGTLQFAAQFLDHLLPALTPASEVGLAVPFPLLLPMIEKAKGSLLKIGAQNMHEEVEGAFTGEVSAVLLKDVGANFVLVGHSERRRLYKEGGPLLHKKIKRALSLDLVPVFCIGETLEEREGGLVQEVLQRQILEGLQGLSLEEFKKVRIAYEPVWAIGTGRSATPDQVEDVHLFCKKTLTSQFGEPLPLLYGGSVKVDSSRDLLGSPYVDGVLVGGASLDPIQFLTIIRNSL